jgi:hypothetical protein
MRPRCARSSASPMKLPLRSDPLRLAHLTVHCHDSTQVVDHRLPHVGLILARPWSRLCAWRHPAHQAPQPLQEGPRSWPSAHRRPTGPDDAQGLGRGPRRTRQGSETGGRRRARGSDPNSRLTEGAWASRLRCIKKAWSDSTRRRRTAPSPLPDARPLRRRRAARASDRIQVRSRVSAGCGRSAGCRAS